MFIGILGVDTARSHRWPRAAHSGWQGDEVGRCLWALHYIGIAL
jgi:hypothetical protein